jgi:hypothetical protein
MKKWLALMAALVSTFAVFAREQKVRDVDIEVTLFKTGEALIHEKWDVNTGDEITEWYLPRENLGDIGIAAFKVYSDGKELSDDGEWDVDRSRSQKAGRFGIVHKRSGVELCWGIGDYGDHVFEPVYLMTNVVKTLDDYDMIHMQFVTDELAAPPQHVRVTIKAADELGIQLDTNTTRAWGFGYSGTVSFENGTVVFESDEPFRYKSSVISLLRFNKGIFESPSVQEREFSDVLSLAMSGADFGDGNSDEDEDTPGDIAAFFTMLVMYLAGRKLVRKASGKVSRRDKKKILGTDPNSVGWCRDIPFNGNLIAADYTLTRLGEDRKKNALASAEILRMIYKGYLDVHKDANGNVEISFAKSKEGKDPVDEIANDLWSMMLEASGDDRVLQDKEFSKWSKRNTKRLYNWTSKVTSMGSNQLRSNGWMAIAGSAYSAAGQEQARNLIGFRKFLDDFTLTGQRETIEAHLWQEYLVFGALLGVADKVAKQLKDIDPILFEKTVGYDYGTFHSVLYNMDALSRSITNASVMGAPSTSYSGGSRGGYGGHSSFGGGGGFSGGGHGGGGR